MNIEAIKSVVNSEDMTKEQKEYLILDIISNDNNAIPYILSILENERNQNKELISDSNLELSRALIILNDSGLKASKDIIAEPKWVVEQIKKHYIKWKDRVTCTFKFNGLP